MIESDSTNCKLSIYKSDYELIIGQEGKTVSSCPSPGFELLVKQARTCFGIKKGRYMFEIKILRYLPAPHFYGFNACAKNQFIKDFIKEEDKCLVRVGWATQHAAQSSSLGVDYDSTGYESTGTRYYTGKYKKYGETFGVGDVVRCCIDLDGHNKSFSYFKNGQFQGIAYRISNKLTDKSYFPAINIRNAEVQFNFGGPDFFPIIVQQPIYTATSPPSSIQQQQQQLQSSSTQVQQQQSQLQQSSSFGSFEQKGGSGSAIPNTQNLVSREEIKIHEYNFVGTAPEEVREYEQAIQLHTPPEAIFMVGLPACGKTTFAQNYVKGQSELILVGSYQIFEHIIDNLQVHILGLTVLMDICNHIFSRCLKLIARLQKKSVVIDQCNVLLKARMKKLLLFKNFTKKAIVIVLGDADQRKRMLKRERHLLTQRQVYPKLCLESFRNLQENFVLPCREEGFQEIEYLEVEEETASIIQVMNNLVALDEIHPLLKKYDFKKVRQARDKNKPQVINQPILPNPQQMQPFNNLIISPITTTANTYSGTGDITASQQMLPQVLQKAVEDGSEKIIAEEIQTQINQQLQAQLLSLEEGKKRN